MFNNYSKPGKGVEKGEKRKNGFFQFFYSSYLYFTKIFFINFLAIPLIAIFAVFMEAVKHELGLSPGGEYIFNIFSALYFTLVGISPVTFGFCRVASYLAEEKPVFIMSDFLNGIKENIKQSLIIFAVNAVVFYLFTVSFKFYFISGLGSSVMPAFIIALVIYLIMNIYIGCLTVNFKIKTGDIYKKALAFTLINLPQNILILIILILIYAIAFFMTTLLGYMAFSLIFYGFSILLINLYALRTIEKYKKD
ncbi:MAG: hypothetical protein E7411_05215 [Ruminococcaceae bacterium]|nr:hypothetical protein [Oscillospiraceae bacterium]